MATVRMTGLISNMDTESIIKGLVDAQKLKNKKVTDKQTKLTWQQEKWKELNTKLYKLYTEDLTKMKTQGSYLAKSVSSSNEALATVTGDITAPVGAHSLSIDTLASSQYVTGGKLASTVTGTTKLKDLGMTSSDGNDLVIKLKNGDKEKNLIVSGTTTLNDFISACQGIGLNASYDKAQQRLFVSSKSSGDINKFSITTGEIASEGTAALSNINSLVNYTGIGSTGQTNVAAAIKTLEGKTISDTLYNTVMNTDPSTPVVGATTEEQTIINALTTLRDYAITKAETSAKAAATQQTKDEIITSKLSLSGEPDTATLDALKVEIQNEITAGKLPAGTDVTLAATERYKQNEVVLKDMKNQIDAKVESGVLTVPDGKTREEYVNETAQTAYSVLVQSDKTNMFNSLVEKELTTESSKNRITELYNANVNSYKTEALTGTNGLVKQVKDYIQYSGITDSTGTSNLTKIGLAEITGDAVATTTSDKLTVVAASDATVTLDGATLTSSTNTIKANGLTITAKGGTPAGTTLSLNVASSTQANYDMVKNFITSYNSILKEMNSLYYADSSRGYDPLSDDDKEAMTDSEIEKWETKITDSILRRDTTLGSLITAMKTSMSSTISVDGKKYSLANYGIGTSSDYSEKGLLHINGNDDDSDYAEIDDKLMKALEEDPDTTMQVLSGITKNLYDTMYDKMDSIPNVRSALTFYNDKTMATQQTAYTKQIAILEDKLVDLEDKYYAQFSAMETALAKLQSQSNALSSMLGTSS